MRNYIAILGILILIGATTSCQKSRNDKFGQDLAGSWSVDTLNEYGSYYSEYKGLHDSLKEDSTYTCSGSLNLDELGKGWMTISAHQAGQTFLLFDAAVNFEAEHRKEGNSWNTPQNIYTLTDDQNMLNLELRYSYGLKSFKDLQSFAMVQDYNIGEAVVPPHLWWKRN